MLREQAALINRIAMLGDLFVIGGSFCLAYFIVSFLIVPLAPFTTYAWFLLIALPVWMFLLQRHQLYSSIRRLSILDIFLKLLNSQIVALPTLGLMIYLFDKDHFSRTLFLSFSVFCLLLLFIEKLSVRAGLGFFRKRGYNTRNLLIVGTREKAQQLRDLVADHGDWGLKIIGFLQAVADEPLQKSVGDHEILGYAGDLLDVCKKSPVDEVVFCLPKDLFIDAEEHLSDLQELGITVRMVIDFYDIKFTKKEFSLFHNELPILTFYSKCLNPQQLLVKRMLDIIGALVGLSITLFLFPIIALAIKKDSPGPLFFGQERVGESGRSFICWKFRSMSLDAEERKQGLMVQNEMSGAIFKIRHDPRVTKVGNFLRKTSLDELPQFWNVLRGEMSLVGTRPPTPEEVSHYENWHHRRISIKPGMTGLWQVSGRNEISDFDEIVRLDLAYIDNWNSWLDLKLLLKTVKIVFTRQGSC